MPIEEKNQPLKLGWFLLLIGGIFLNWLELIPRLYILH